MTTRTIAPCLLLLLAPAVAAGTTVTSTFEDVDLLGDPNVRYDHGDPYVDDAGGSPVGSFVSGGAAFTNKWNTSYGIIDSGFAISRATDNGLPAGYTRPYAAITGGGAGGSATYAVAVAYGEESYFNNPDRPNDAFVDLGAGLDPVSMAITNTSYVDSILTRGDPNGIGHAFGPGDFLEVVITGYDRPGGVGATVGSPVTFFLADFTGGRSDVVNDWRTVDLTGLAGARSLRFAMISSDTDPVFGINTPAYFAIDDLVLSGSSVTPEPSTLAMAGLGLAVAAAASARRRRR